MIKLIIFIVPFLLNASSIITPIPFEVAYDKKKAMLGKKLFFDPILSKDNTISCASCHNLPGNGANSSAYSFGVDGTEGGVNSPTVLNAVFNFVQFWDGRAQDLKEQALEPIINPVEMANSIENVLFTLNNSSYKEKFEKIYKDGITQDNLAEVIAEFEKTLITPNSRFDRYIRGDKSALNDQEKKGFELFKEIGCASCHNGINVGGNMYQKLGRFDDYIQDKNVSGRYAYTNRERDKDVFKVPSLRNIELTAPYFHDGQVETLKDTINKMQALQLGVVLDDEETHCIESFLKTLTGEMPVILKEEK